MIAQFERPNNSKDLFFNLNHAMQLAMPPLQDPKYKIAGLYVIYKDDVCYYVGQSKNLPSRLASHLTGKYSECDRIEIYFIDGFDNFYTRNAESQTSILENNEMFLIQQLKPIENLMVDYDKTIPENQLFDSFVNIDSPEELGGDLDMYYDRNQVTITDSRQYFITHIDQRLVNENLLICNERFTTSKSGVITYETKN